jgi:hypothetical protein
MAMTFDATLKDLGRDSPHGFQAAFDRPPTLPVKVLNADLSAVTTAADLVLGLGDPLEEIIQLDFQASASAKKHSALLVYHALLFDIYQVPVHTVIILLRPEAAHKNTSGTIRYAPRPKHGSMKFKYQVVPLGKRPAEELLAADVGVAPLAMLGRLPRGLALEDRLAAVAQRVVDRLINQAPPDRVQKLLTEAYLLTGLRVRRDVAARIFRGVRAMHESDTFLAILDEGQEKFAKKALLSFGEKRLGSPAESVREGDPASDRCWPGGRAPPSSSPAAGLPGARVYPGRKPAGASAAGAENAAHFPGPASGGWGTLGSPGSESLGSRER